MHPLARAGARVRPLAWGACACELPFARERRCQWVAVPAAASLLPLRAPLPGDESTSLSPPSLDEWITVCRHVGCVCQGLGWGGWAGVDHFITPPPPSPHHPPFRRAESNVSGGDHQYGALQQRPAGQRRRVRRRAGLLRLRYARVRAGKWLLGACGTAPRPWVCLRLCQYPREWLRFTPVPSCYAWAWTRAAVHALLSVLRWRPGGHTRPSHVRVCDGGFGWCQGRRRACTRERRVTALRHCLCAFVRVRAGQA